MQLDRNQERRLEENGRRCRSPFFFIHDVALPQQKRLQTRSSFTLLLLTLTLGLLAPIGCRNCDRVESELRSKETELRELRVDLQRSEAMNEALLREAHGTPASISSKPNNTSMMTPDATSQAYTLKEVILGRQTGGLDDDSVFGDEALQVVLEPRDHDGHAIKVPGTLQVCASEIGTDGLKTPISSWEIPAERLHRTWRNGLLSTGYYVVLPWKRWPTKNKIRVVARFTLADGRLFEADKDITIRLTKTPKTALPDAENPSEIELPVPRPLESDTPLSSVPASPSHAVVAWQTPPTSAPSAPAAHLMPPVARRSDSPQP